MDLMTEAQFKEALPAKVKKSVNPEVLKLINDALLDTETREQFKENLLTYADVIKEGRFKVTGYISAVKYVSCKLLGATNKDAYAKTFPDKYCDFLARGVPAKDIASYSTAFNGSKLVQLIFAQTMMPTHVLNAPIFQQAINTQAELMLTASSEKVRSDAANSLMTHLKPPEIAKVELDVNIKQDDSIKLLSATTIALAQEQQKRIIAGTHSVKAIAESSLSDAIDITPKADNNE